MSHIVAVSSYTLRRRWTGFRSWTTNTRSLRPRSRTILGHLDEAVRLASRYLKSRSIASRRWRLLSVLASAKWDQGELAESIDLTRQAHHWAVETGEAAAIARSAVPLLERTCNSSALRLCITNIGPCKTSYSSIGRRSAVGAASFSPRPSRGALRKRVHGPSSLRTLPFFTFEGLESMAVGSGLSRSDSCAVNTRRRHLGD